MPQQLIRLTSSSGDGVFNGVFNQGITIKENSEIALQSLSVERRSQEISINGENGAISFSSVSATGTPAVPNQTTSLIPQQLYDKSNSQELLDNIGTAMNRTCDLNVDNGQWGIQHNVSVGSGGLIEVGARISPFYQIQKQINCDFVVDDRPVVRQVANAEILNVDALFQAGELGMWRETDTTTGGGGAEPALNESYVFGTEPVIKSTGMFRTRFKRLNTNGAGTASFTMGLVKGADGLSKLQNSSFTLADCAYAIRTNGHTSPMQYIRSKGGAWINTVTPVNHTTANWELNLNDVLDISFQSGAASGVISSETAGTPTRTELLSAIDYDIKDNYYWFISMHEGKDNCVLDLTGITLDPWHNIGIGEPTSIRDDNIAPGEIESSAIDGLPHYNMDQGAVNIAAPFTPSVQMSSVLSSYLGFSSSYLKKVDILPPVQVFTDTALEGDPGFLQRLGYIFTANIGYDNSYDSDTYLIDTQTFTLDSFDSYGLSAVDRAANSGGSRRNIIATVPITETPIVGSGNSLIQFQPNTLFYVSIKNRGDLETRQIRCRLLTGQYNAVSTEGVASIVLLIRDTQGYSA